MTVILGRLKGSSAQLIMARHQVALCHKTKKTILVRVDDSANAWKHFVRSLASRLVVEPSDRRGIRSHSDTSGTLTY